MFHSVAKVAVKKFDPAGLKDGENILTAFNEFCASFDYAYEAQNRRPPDSEDTQAKKDAWIAQDKRRIFLGDYSKVNERCIFPLSRQSGRNSFFAIF